LRLSTTARQYTHTAMVEARLWNSTNFWQDGQVTVHMIHAWQNEKRAS
jgi:hypothetical protein